MESACANKVGWKITGRGLCPTVDIILADNENVYVKNQIPLFHPPARHSCRKSKLAEKLVREFIRMLSKQIPHFSSNNFLNTFSRMSAGFNLMFSF